VSGGIPLVGVLDLVRVDALISSRCGTKVHTSPSAREVLTNRQQVAALDGTAVIRSTSPIARPQLSVDGCPRSPVGRVIHVLGHTRGFRRVGVADRLSAESVSDENRQPDAFAQRALDIGRVVAEALRLTGCCSDWAVGC